MNILLDYLPNSAEINGKKYEFHCDFRTSIIFSIMMNDDSLSDEEKLYGTLQLYYPIIPDDIEQAVDYIYWFYSRGKKEPDKKQAKDGKKLFKRNSNRAFDFEEDANLIFSAFMTQYNINLNKDNLHWWEFMTLFDGLNDDHEIVKIMNYRTIDINSIENKEDKKLYRSLQQYYSLDNKITSKEEQALQEARARLDKQEGR